MDTSSECQPQVALRRKKSAAERRAQQLRSDTRALQRLVSGLRELRTHRGSSLSLVGEQLHGLIMVHMACPRAVDVPIPVFRPRRTPMDTAGMGEEDRKLKRADSDPQSSSGAQQSGERASGSADQLSGERASGSPADWLVHIWQRRSSP